MSKALGGALLLAGVFLLGSGSAWADDCVVTDLDGDGWTTAADFEVFKGYMLAEETFEGFEPVVVLDPDGVIDFRDLAILQDCL